MSNPNPKQPPKTNSASTTDPKHVGIKIETPNLIFFKLEAGTTTGKCILATWGVGIAVSGPLFAVSWVYGVIAGVSFFFLGLGVWFVLSRFPKKATVDYSGSTIRVFIPNPELAAADEFYQDGAQQYAGFMAALKDHQKPANHASVGFVYLNKDADAATIMGRMQEEYQNYGATYFIMTMSSKIQSIRQLFVEWHKACREKNERLPVLIATVTSAPEIADVKNGIVRWYVRAKEESKVLAEYLAWAQGASRGAVFYFTHDPGADNSPFGTHSKRIFSKRFERIGGTVNVRDVTHATAVQQVQKWFDEMGSDETAIGIYVVGYGNVLRDTLTAILDKLASQPRPWTKEAWIACTSTLACAKDWQPQDQTHDARIVTVRPMLRDPTKHLPNMDRNIVHLFSREVLRRVLELTSPDRDAKRFLDRWINGDGADPRIADYALDQEHLANGDVIVHVDIADKDYWRIG